MHIFLAHATEDKAQVRALYHKLKELGFDPWLDEFDLIPGLPWAEQISKAIASAAVFLACLSRNSTQKRGHVQEEFRSALEEYRKLPSESIYLIPVRFDDCDVPDLRISNIGIGLSDLHWVDLFTDSGFERLIHAIRRALDRNTSKIDVETAPEPSPEASLPSGPSVPLAHTQTEELQTAVDAALSPKVPGESASKEQEVNTPVGKRHFSSRFWSRRSAIVGGAAVSGVFAAISWYKKSSTPAERLETAPKTTGKGTKDLDGGSGPNSDVIKDNRTDKAKALTSSEIDALRSQISRCWTLPAGIDGNKIPSIVVKLRIEVRPDRTVQRVSIVDTARLDSDPTYRAVAESALRAVGRCGKLNLPDEKYSLWRDINMSFRPPAAFGNSIASTTVELTHSQKENAQRALVDLGIYTGKIDGIFGNQTREAIKIWQRSQGIAATGHFQNSQIFELLLDQARAKEGEKIHQGL